RRDRGECRRRLRLGRALAQHPAVGGALRSGDLNLAQAEVVVRAVDALPAEVNDQTRAAAEERLVTEAARFGPRQLRILGRRVLEVVAPQVAEDIEGRLLAQEEAHAADNVFVRVRRRGDGTTDLHIRTDHATADRFLTYLHAYTSPRRADDQPDSAGPVEDRRPYDQRLGAAFAAFLEAIDPQRLPLHGGDATTVIITVGLDQLRNQLGVAHLADEPITAAHARRLACTASILPAVLDGKSTVLDLGRTRRLFSPAQRKALAIRYPVCAADGCDIPAPWCEAHHAGHPWATGGHTDLADGVLLCSFHHHRAHDTRHRTDRMPDGSVRFTRRT
ncbi:HNH endonuclease signature motif containing protein, partial [Nocardioides aquiterrae]|uniref:HNH endonuclease signature motif containing protein n=1 Tax=Nocardioides aquiterrae TaxID=203799 RepID=UPI0031CDD6E2